jgi:hypothetical protein
MFKEEGLLDLNDDAVTPVCMHSSTHNVLTHNKNSRLPLSLLILYTN